MNSLQLPKGWREVPVPQPRGFLSSPHHRDPSPQNGYSLAAAREQLDAAMAALLEAATAEVHEDAQLRKAMAEGQQLERRRLQAIIISHLELHARHTDPVRVALLNVLEDFAA